MIIPREPAQSNHSDAPAITTAVLIFGKHRKEQVRKLLPSSMTASTGGSKRQRLCFGVEEMPIFRTQTFSNLALHPVTGVCVRKWGFHAIWALSFGPARQQLEEPRLREKEPPLEYRPKAQRQ